MILNVVAATEIRGWVQAGAAVLAVLVSATAAGFAGAAWKRERRRDEKRDETEQRAQADLVAAWSVRKVDAVAFDPETTTFAEAEELRNAWGALVVNRSALPVYAVDVTFYVGGQAGHPHPIGVGLVPPGDRFVDWPPAMRDDSLLDGIEELVHVAIRFRDTGGRVWERDRNGELRPVE